MLWSVIRFDTANSYMLSQLASVLSGAPGYRGSLLIPVNYDRIIKGPWYAYTTRNYP